MLTAFDKEIFMHCKNPDDQNLWHTIIPLKLTEDQSKQQKYCIIHYITLYFLNLGKPGAGYIMNEGYECLKSKIERGQLYG